MGASAEQLLARADELRSTLGAYKSEDPVALQIERRGRLQYISFDLP